MTTDRPRDGQHIDRAGTGGPTTELRYPTRIRVLGRRATLAVCLVLVAAKILYVDGLGPDDLGTDTAVLSLALSVVLTVGNWTWAVRPAVTACRSPRTDPPCAPRAHPDTDAADALTRAADSRSRARRISCLAMIVSAQTHGTLVDHAGSPVVVGICTAICAGIAALAVTGLVRHRRLEVAARHVLPARERSTPCS